MVLHDCGPAVYREDAAVDDLLAAPKAELRGESFPGCVPLSKPEKARDRPLRHCKTSSIPERDSSLQGELELGHCYRMDAAWAYTDIFVYFSHARVTIPPVGWIDVAHRYVCAPITFTPLVFSGQLVAEMVSAFWAR
jgi:hypothetical protein